MATRSKTIDEVFALVSSKLDEFDVKFEDKLKKYNHTIIENLKEEIRLEIEKITEIYEQKIVTLESSVAMLQKHITTLKRSNEEKIEELDQYGRRLCLRINGIEMKKDETSGDVFNLVKEKIVEAKVDIPNCVVDRAHRIGKVLNNRDGKPSKAIIVRFTTFRHRTIFYRARKKIGNISVQLDLSKTRYNLLKEAKALTEDLEDVKFVYADINCRLKVHLKDDSEMFFSSIDNLKSILNY